jgi:hypothetical protein
MIFIFLEGLKYTFRYLKLCGEKRSVLFVHILLYFSIKFLSYVPYNLKTSQNINV